MWEWHLVWVLLDIKRGAEQEANLDKLPPWDARATCCRERVQRLASRCGEVREMRKQVGR
eukprot:4909595-Amphidinium_carterae.1